MGLSDLQHERKILDGRRILLRTIQAAPGIIDNWFGSHYIYMEDCRDLPDNNHFQPFLVFNRPYFKGTGIGQVCIVSGFIHALCYFLWDKKRYRIAVGCVLIALYMLHYRRESFIWIHAWSKRLIPIHGSWFVFPALVSYGAKKDNQESFSLHPYAFALVYI
jgi:hypothetical protein